MANKNSSESQLAERLARFEGREEQQLRFVSKDVLMAPINEVLTALRREAIKPEPTGPAFHEVPVLLVGETGVGQEMLAHLIHEGSRRSQGPWINVSLSGLTSEEQETELFSEKVGACELATGGTLFLGDISKMAVVNQRRFFEGMKKHQWNFRLLASVTKEIFPQITPEVREYFATATLKIPSLRERTEDLMPMAMHFAEKTFKVYGKHFVGFTTEAERILRIYSWPGNVRELWVMMQRLALVWTSGKAVGEAAFMGLVTPNRPEGREGGRVLELVRPGFVPPVATDSDEGYTEIKKKWSDTFERDYLVKLLTRHEGNVSSAARESKLDRSNFLRLLRRHAIKSAQYREDEHEVKKVA